MFASHVVPCVREEASLASKRRKIEFPCRLCGRSGQKNSRPTPRTKRFAGISSIRPVFLFPSAVSCWVDFLPPRGSRKSNLSAMVLLLKVYIYTPLVLNWCSASFLQVFRKIIKAEFFFIIIVTLEEFYNIFQNIKFK